MKLWKVQTWMVIFTVAAALAGGTLGYVYLKIGNFKVASDKAKMEASINKLIEKQADIDARLNQLEADYEHQQAAIDDLSKKISDARSITLIEQTLIGFCLDTLNRQKNDYCSQIGAN